MSDLLLSFDERRELSNSVGNKTFEDAMSHLNESGKCLVVRPTGIGKTYLLHRIADEYIKKYPKKRVLFLCPTNIIRTEVNSKYPETAKHLTFESFQTISLAYGDVETAKWGERPKEEKDRIMRSKLEKRKKLEKLFSESSIVLIDEVHRAASERLRDFFDEANEIFGSDKTHLIGVTATVDRQAGNETHWIKKELFDGVEVFDYSLADAFADEILLPPHIVQPIFDLDRVLDDIEEDAKKQRVGKSYDSFQMVKQSCEEIRYKWGNNGKDIYNAMAEVGFRLDSDNPEDSFARFIVFFSDTQQMYSEGANVESYFRMACNSVASSSLGRKVETEINVEYVISSTADFHNEMIIRDFCEEEDYRTYRDSASDVCLETYVDKNGNKQKRYIPPRAHTVSLIFNIGTIEMGYHVPYIAGVMLMANTNSSIRFFQQIGRCFSIENKKTPIIFDPISNCAIERSVKTTKERFDFGQMLVNTMSDNQRINGGGAVIDAVQSGINKHASEDWLSMIGGLASRSSAYIARIKYLYVDRNMPVVFVAADMEETCSSVVKCLRSMNIDLRSEDAEYFYLERGIPRQGDTLNVRANKYNYDLIGFLFSERAYKMLKKFSESKAERSVFRRLFNKQCEV